MSDDNDSEYFVGHQCPTYETEQNLNIDID